MSQLWQINGQWLNLEQMKMWRKKEDERLLIAKEESEKLIVEVTEEKISDDIPSVADVLSVDTPLPESKPEGFVESELAGCTVMELREIAKQNSIRIKGQPSKLQIINILMKK